LFAKVKKYRWSIIILSVIFLIMFLLNWKTLYVADDYVYRFVYQSPSPTAIPHQQRITTWLIPESMWNHYQLWNGRILAHSIVQFFMQFNSKIPFDISSSLIYVLLLVFMDKIAVNLSGKQHNAFILPLIFGFTWFFIPYFGQTVLWLSGSGNYLWMSVIYLGFIIFNLKNRQSSFTNIFSAIVLGFLTGATNENSGPAAVLIVLLFMFQRLIMEYRVSLVSSISVIFSGLGFAVMMLSPGTQTRGTVHRDWSIFQKNLAGIYKLTFDKWLGIYLLLAVLLIVAIIMKRVTAATIFSAIFFLIGHLAAVYAMAFSPEYPERTFFGGVIFLGIAVFILVYAIIGDWQRSTAALSVIVMGMFAISFGPAYHDINLSYHQMQVEYQMIYHAAETKDKKARIPLMTMSQSRYNANYGVIALDTPPTALMNLWEAKFFGVNEISGYRVK